MSVLRVRIVKDHIVGGREDEEGNMVPVEEDDVEMGQEDDVFFETSGLGVDYCCYVVLHVNTPNTSIACLC